MRESRRAAASLAGLGLLALLLGGCAASTATRDYDPLETVNRKIFWFNEKADEYALEPVARAWDWIAPKRVQRSVSNFFLNLRFPINTVNDLLQGEPRHAGMHTSRFLVNSVFGLGGLFDPAADWGLVAQEEDFGQTLGQWGVGAGPYLMLPLLGPSTVRDVVRFPVDGTLSGLGFALDGFVLIGMTAGEFVNFRARTLGDFDAARAASLDFYAFVRNAYLQRRLALIHDSNVIPADEGEDLYDLDQYDDGDFENTPFN